MSGAELLRARDREQILARGMNPESVQRDLRHFAASARRALLLRPCRIGDGITAIAEADQPSLLARAEEAAAAGRFSVFVPASGAATRMFESLLPFLSERELDPADLERRARAGDGAARDLLRLAREVEEFAFLDPGAHREDGARARALVAAGDYRALLHLLLAPEGLAYGDRPKALVAFHRYEDHCRTPFEEHLVEAAAYAADARAFCRLHFTVTAQHEPSLQELLEERRAEIEERLKTRFAVTFSVQDPATDTLAVDLENRPFRLADGSLLFRPGGHGSLLVNLERLGGDIVFVKNIDNVVPDRLKGLTVRWKKLLAGLLLDLQDRSFHHLERLDTNGCAAEDEAAAAAFVASQFGQAIPAGATRREQLIAQLDRPLRVCGVVENRGEPGGGPFWVEGKDGAMSRQIVESAEVDLEDARQRSIWGASTHFNPVDIVCGLRDRHGNPYPLDRYRDPDAVFIAAKTHAGQPIRALEHPGLWNGGMAHWNTVFVEVPAETFAPVKTVLDLLRPEHQA